MNALVTVGQAPIAGLHWEEKYSAFAPTANLTHLLNPNLPSSHRPVLLHPYLGVGGAPDFSVGVERGDPEEVVLRAIVDHGEREALAPVDDGHGQRRIELGEHGACDPDGGGRRLARASCQRALRAFGARSLCPACPYII